MPHHEGLQPPSCITFADLPSTVDRSAILDSLFTNQTSLIHDFSKMSKHNILTTYLTFIASTQAPTSRAAKSVLSNYLRHIINELAQESNKFLALPSHPLTSEHPTS
mmetsp:Transcript_30250/g.53532  ORF Transcript_30250/g.53532 Transcript_30250/m.53532 type:complete len:107 (-) Transcript_30250:180-500(-)